MTHGGFLDRTAPDVVVHSLHISYVIMFTRVMSARECTTMSGYETKTPRSSRLDPQLALSPRTRLDSPARLRKCIRGCSAPDHSHEDSRDPTRSSPYRLTPDPTRSPARASVFVAAVCPTTRTGVVVTQPARSLSPSQEPMRDPPDHIVPNPHARACASVAAVRPITHTGMVTT